MAREYWAPGPHLAMPMRVGCLSLLLPGSVKGATRTSQVRGGVVEWGSSVTSHSIQFWLKSLRPDGIYWKAAGSHRLEEGWRGQFWQLE